MLNVWSRTVQAIKSLRLNCVVCIQDVSKKKWILTGTVGSGGFGLIYFAEEQVSRPPYHFYRINNFSFSSCQQIHSKNSGWERAQMCSEDRAPWERTSLCRVALLSCCWQVVPALPNCCWSGSTSTIFLFRPEHLKAWNGPAHLPALWGYGSHTVGDEKLRWLEVGLLCKWEFGWSIYVVLDLTFKS